MSKDVIIIDADSHVMEPADLWGSDFPHVDSTMQAAKLIRAAITDLTPARQQAVLGKKAARLFQMQE